MHKKTINIKSLTIIAMLAAISTVLMFLSFSIPLFPIFLKLDFSEVPALIAAFSLGPFAGVSVVFIKNLINLLFTSSGGIGEFANFLIGSFFVFSAGLVYQKFKTRKGAILSMTVGTIIMSIVGTVANYYILMPLYTLVMPIDSIVNMFKSINPYVDTMLKIMFMTIAPFNLLKGFIVSLITFLIYKKLSPIIKRIAY